MPRWNTVQREGISTSHTSRCLLINSGIHNQEALCNEMLELDVETDNYTKGFLDKQCKNCESNILKSWDPGKSFGQKCFVVQIVTPATQCVVDVVLMLRSFSLCMGLWLELFRLPWLLCRYCQFEGIVRVMMDCQGHLVESCFIAWSNVVDCQKIDTPVDVADCGHLGIPMDEADCSSMNKSAGEGSSMFSSMEHLEAFLRAVPHTVEHSLCSEDADLGSLVARVIGLSVHAMLVKHRMIAVRSVLLLVDKAISQKTISPSAWGTMLV